MKSQLVLQSLLILMAVGSVASFGYVGLIIGAVKGLSMGILKGSIGAFGPVAKDGFNSMGEFFGDLGTLGNELGNLGGVAANAAKQGIGAMGGLSNLGGLTSMFGGFGDVISGILGSWISLFQQLLSGGIDLFSGFFGAIWSMFENLFSILGGLTGGSRLEINRMVANTGDVFGTAMHLKLNPQLNRQAIRQELLTVQKLIETPHKTGEDLVKSLSSKAPHLSSAASQAFVLAKAEMHKHVSAMNPEAKKGVEKMRLVVAHAKLDMGDILGSIMGGGKGSPFGSMFNVAFSIIKNLFSLFQMFF